MNKKLNLKQVSFYAGVSLSMSWSLQWHKQHMIQWSTVSFIISSVDCAIMENIITQEQCVSFQSVRTVVYMHVDGGSENPLGEIDKL